MSERRAPDGAVALHTEATVEPIEDEEPFLREIGIDTDEIPDEPEELPDFLK